MFVGVCGEGGKVEEREDVLEKGKTFVGWSTCFSMEYSLLMTYQQLLKFKIKFNTNFTESSTGPVHINDPVS